MSTQLYVKPTENDLLAAVRAYIQRSGKDATVAAIGEANGWDIQDVGGPLFKMVRDGTLNRNREQQTFSIPGESLPRLPLIARPPLKLAEAPAPQRPKELPQAPAPTPPTLGAETPPEPDPPPPPAPPTPAQSEPPAELPQQLRLVVPEEQPKPPKQPHARPDVPPASELIRQMAELERKGIRNPIITLARQYLCDVKTIRRRLKKLKPQPGQPAARPSRSINWPPDPEFLRLLEKTPKQQLAISLGCTIWAIDYHRQIVEKRAGEPNPGEIPAPLVQSPIPTEPPALQRGASTVVDPNRKHSPDTLPGQLGLTEGQSEIARQAIEEAVQGPVTMKELMGALKAVLYNLDDSEISGPVEAVTHELVNWEELLYISIAYRAFHKGMEVGKQTEASG